MLRYLDDPSLSLEPINLFVSFHTIIKLVAERLHAVELWQAYFKCVQVSQIKNKKDLYYLKSAQIKELLKSVQQIIWCRSEFDDDRDYFDDSIFFDLSILCRNFDEKINVFLFG